MKKDFCIVTIKDGIIQNRKALKDLFTVNDGKYLVERSDANKRSNPQNRYYFGLVIPLIQKGIKDMGTELTVLETHEFLKARFNLSELVNEGTGETISVPLSTTRLNKSEFSEYVEKIQLFAAEFLNIIIPDPGVQTEIEY
jgi:hypothetical protein